MKKLLMTLILVIMSVPAMAQEHSHDHGGDWLKPVEANHVCMMNNKLFDTPQIAIEVEGKTYYGCCPMCADKLKNNSSLRAAIDPVSGKQVDKADAVIGADSNGMTYYFENKENFHAYASGQKPEAKDGAIEGATKSQEGGEHSSSEAPAPAAPENHEAHH